MRAEVPDYGRLQDEVADASRGVDALEILDLGTGTGETAAKALHVHPQAKLTGIDSSGAMLAAARARLDPARVDLRCAHIEDALPAGVFDLVVSALTVHHLYGESKAGLFERVAGVLAPGGRFVLADVVIPDRAEDAVTPLDSDYDHPSTAAEQVAWLEALGFSAALAWERRDLAVIVADRR
jgi:tRNA (cmo5U34)-methyltransferase